MPTPHSGRMDNLRSSQSKGIKRHCSSQSKEWKLLGWIGAVGKKTRLLWIEKISGTVTLTEEEHRKPITEHRKPKPVALDEEDSRKPNLWI